ncbi:two-component sensor kinase/response regulator [Citrobacter youngae]|nr:two-component sensor kinase/response regulator [Citrobacter youngae]
MTNYSLRARMMILILAPTVLIGLLLSIFLLCIAITTCSVNWKMLVPASSSHSRFPANTA